MDEEKKNLVEIDADKILTDNILVFEDRERALKVASLLMDEGTYVVMLSTEEALTILNYVEVVGNGFNTRSYVAFNNREALSLDL